jgi:HSP20 family molecular chaperone IbpA
MSLTTWGKDFVVANPNFDIKKEDNKITISSEIKNLGNEKVDTRYEDDYLTVSIHSDNNEEKEENGVKIWRRNKHNYENSWYLPNYNKDSLKANKEGNRLSICLDKSK